MAFKIANTLELEHLHLLVQSLDVMTDFYNTLGLQILNRTTNQVEFANPGNTKPILILSSNEKVSLRPPHTTGLFHFAILVPTREDLAYVIGNLLNLAIPITGAGDHIYSEAFYLNDPEGNGIEIYRDRPRSEWLSDGKGGLITGTEAVDIEGVMALYDNLRLWTGFPKGTALGHIHLNVSIINDATTYFYIDALGLDIMTNFHDSALFLSAGGYHHHIAVNTWQGVGASLPPQQTTGLLSYTLSLSSQEELQQLIANLQAHQVPHTLENGRLCVLDFNQDAMNFYIR
ncbi:VOC family protein [Lysinibacillus parviboronicapiens]|uniref:VOC family protein n=1 Tax=Lysinibacillus parviboronicapiens TaxID=436516 RepID=UPI0006D26C98|nr:VOC family protein [Lysinibacillus parviboronicapiens]